MMTTVFQEGPPVRGLVDQGGLGFDRPAVFHLLVIVSTVVLRQTSSLIPCIYLLSPLLDPSNMFLVLKTLFKVKTQEISRLLAVPDRPDLRYGTGRFFLPADLFSVCSCHLQYMSYLYISSVSFKQNLPWSLYALSHVLHVDCISGASSRHGLNFLLFV